MAEGFRKGGMGYGDAKKTLLAQFEKRFGGETLEKRRFLDAHPDKVEEVLMESAKKEGQADRRSNDGKSLRGHRPFDVPD